MLLTGPGKIGAALALDTSFSGHALFEPGGLTLHEGEPAREVLAGARVGIDYAEPIDRDRPLRFAVRGSRWITKANTLSPLIEERRGSAARPRSARR